MKQNKIVLAISIIFITLSIQDLHPSTFDVFGCGSRGIAMGNALTSLSDDWCAPYYNPAGITNRKNTLGGGIIYSFDALKIIPYGDAKATENIENTFGLHVGVTNSFGTERFRFGIAIYTPLDRVQLQRTHFVDEREAFFSNQLHFELYGERTQRQIILPVLAYRIFDWLSVGAGVSLFIYSRTDSYVYLPDIFDQSKAYINVNNKQKYTYVPDIGILISPLNQLWIGLSYMGSDDFPIIGRSFVQVPQLNQEFVQIIDQYVFYTPPRISLGAGYRISDALTASFDLLWWGWSNFHDNHGKKPEPGWRDTFAPRAGIEYQLMEHVILRGGFSFEASPVPPQRARQNFVDNDREIFSIGAGFPFKIDTRNCEASIHFQYQQFNKRKTIKEVEYDADPDEPGVQNPGFPGYESSGALFSAGLDVGYRF